MFGAHELAGSCRRKTLRQAHICFCVCTYVCVCVLGLESFVFESFELCVSGIDLRIFQFNVRLRGWVDLEELRPSVNVLGTQRCYFRVWWLVLECLARQKRFRFWESACFVMNPLLRREYFQIFWTLSFLLASKTRQFVLANQLFLPNHSGVLEDRLCLSSSNCLGNRRTSKNWSRRDLVCIVVHVSEKNFRESGCSFQRQRRWIRKSLDLAEEGEKRLTQLMKKAAIAESREQRNSVEGIVVPVGKRAWWNTGAKRLETGNGECGAEWERGEGGGGAQADSRDVLDSFLQRDAHMDHCQDCATRRPHSRPPCLHHFHFRY